MKSNSIVKQKLLGGAIGSAALSLRDKFEILHAAYTNSERLGTLANNQLATKLVTRICQSHKTFIDVGAHIGSIISEVAYGDSSVRIVAFEAVPEKIVRLRRKFPSIELHHCAAGESSGEVSFFVNIGQSAYSSLLRPAGADERAVSEIRVPLKRLDELVSSNDVDVIKIDVEGAELGVLRGSANILKNCRPTIMFESSWSGNDLGYTKEALYQFLSSNDYAVLIPNRVAHNDPGLSQDGFVESHLYPRRTINYFAVPNQRRVEIRDRARNILKIPGA